VLVQDRHEYASPPSDEPHVGSIDFYRHGELFETSNSRAISNIEIARKFEPLSFIPARRLRSVNFDFCRCAASSCASNSPALNHIEIAKTFCGFTRPTYIQHCPRDRGAPGHRQRSGHASPADLRSHSPFS
jgi:hypothetical protein